MHSSVQRAHRAPSSLGRWSRRLLGAAFVGTALALATFTASSAAAANNERTRIGAWSVGASTDASGLVDRCVAERVVGAVTVSFMRNSGGYFAVLQSDAWQLPPQSTYPVRLVAAPSLSTEFTGTVTEEHRISVRLGEGALTADRLRQSQKTVELQGASGTIRFAAAELPAALDAVDVCWKQRAPAVANPFAASAAGSTLAGSRPLAGERLVEEHTFLDIEIYGRIYRLESLIVKPAGMGTDRRLPVALITHGTTTDADEMPLMRASTLLPQARDLAHRGWLAVAVMRRGYGLSQGPGPDSAMNCSNPRFTRAFDADAAELEAALRVIALRPDADASRVIALGVSGGGAAVLGLAARRPAGLAAVVNISGGLNLIRQDGTHCDSEEKLADAFRELGSRSAVPTLWTYAENDSFFQPSLVRRLHEAFTAGGGRAELSLLEPIGRNGHEIFATAQGRYHWLPRLDAFLRTQGLPTWDVGSVDTVMRVGHLEGHDRDWVARYFSAPTGKALVVTASGKDLRIRFGVDDGSAKQTALTECEAAFKEPCRVLMDNFEIDTGTAATASLAPAQDP